MLNNPNLSRREIIDRLKQAAQVTHSTAVSYYERIAKELGHTNKERRGSDTGAGTSSGVDSPSQSSSDASSTSPRSLKRPAAGPGWGAGYVGDSNHSTILSPDRELEGMDSDDPNRIGIIRRIKGAHLVFKRQTSDSSFEELWIYKLDPDNESINIKRSILAGTDIPPNKTSSPDGTQKYQLKSMGDAQLMHITGLPN